ncbi:hypothetical protein SAMN04488511_111180 [Pedobacter suwonensis]|uniref:Uncharacterized protein n=1 Tax=Pedobacter suwonensis TaxID=332999 RepID=A0A1I0TMD8_9SPHI|nr:hypothetical protein SAMN04488511_111180 [Pedobacter suwonensis]
MEINLPGRIVIAKRLFQPTACPDFQGSNLTARIISKDCFAVSLLAMMTFLGILSMVGIIYCIKSI